MKFKRPLVLVLVLALAMSAVTGGTIAWFTDEVTSANNVIQAGNLDVELDYYDANGAFSPVTADTALFNNSALWEPGHTEVAYLRVRNAGTLALKYHMAINIASETGSTNVLGKAFKLSEHLVFDAVEITKAEVGKYTRETAQTAAGTTLGLNSYNTYTGDINAKAADHYVALVVYMPETVGNEANYAKGADVPQISLGVKLTATQKAEESDSFGSDYDAVTNLPVVNTAEGLQTALNAGESVMLGADITLEKTIEVPAGESVTIDLGGHTITGNWHKDNGAVLKNNGTLTVNNGTIKSTADNGGSAVQNNGTMVINNATLNGAPNAGGSWPSYTVNNTGVLQINNSNVTSVHGGFASYKDGAVLTLNNTNLNMTGIPGFTSHGIYTYNNGKVVVNGGNIANNAPDQNASGASVINGAVTVYSGNFTGRIENYSGTPVIYGGTFTVEPNLNFVVAGHKVTNNNNGTWTVELDVDAFLTPDTYKSTAIESNKVYALEGNFNGNNVSLVMPQGVENVIFDGSEATGINELIITQNGQLIDNANAPVGERRGKVTVQNFNVASQINVFACKTEVEIYKNTAEALMVHAGNCAVNVHHNNIDANFKSHPTHRAENATWNTNKYGIALNIFDYDLWLDNNTVTDATGHAIGINGWEGTLDIGEENVIHSFTGNEITVNSTTTKRAALKIWDDETYASNDEDTNVVNATTQAFIDDVLAKGTNTFNILEGYDHTIFSIYNVNTNK